MAKSKGAGPGVAAGMPIQRSGTPSADLAGPLKKSDYFLEAGNTGLKIFGGFVAEEFDPNLRGMRGARMYREMSDSDPTIGAYLYLIFQAVLKLNWHLSPADQSPLSLLAQEALESMMDDMDGTWDEFIQEALTMVIYGYAPMEITLKLRNGSKSDKRFSSIYDDGLVGIRKIALRSQETVLRWIMDPDNNDILGVVQMPWTGGIRMIPMSKMLLFRTRFYRGNPEGRALDPATPIPTPDGWREIDDLHPGDRVFDEAGRIRYVTARADWENRPRYRLTFGDDTEIVADAEHQWLTTTLRERSAKAPPAVRTTAELRSSLKTPVGSSNHGIAWARALDYPAQTVPLDPYVLGLWLGDGSSNCAMISCHVDDLEETQRQIEEAGYPAEAKDSGRPGKGRVIRFYGSQKWASDGPSAALRVLGVMNNKHIPIAYLRGSVEQRRALLSGLMDSDGYVDHTGRCEFCNTNENLARGVTELVQSLGVGARITSKINSHGHTVWLVKFTPTWAPFRLARKIARCRVERQRMNHFVTAVEPIDPGRTVCIEVDSPSHLFLAGRGMIPTHNSLLRNAYRPYYFCKRIEEIEGIGVERDLAGFPVMSVPAETIAAAAQGTDANAVATLEAYKNLVKNIRRNSQEGAVLPSDTDDHGHKMFELTLLSSGGKRNFDTNMIISRYNMQKAATVMADFLMMGHGGASGGGGSRGGGIGSDKIELFYAAIEGLVGSMRDTMNKNLIPLIGQLNGIPQKYWPAFFTDKAEQVDLGKLGAYINSLAASGMVLFPNEDLEDYLLETAGLPTPTEEVRAQQQNIQEQGGETGPGMGGAAQPGQRPSPTAQPPGGMPGQGQPGAAGDPRMGAQGAYGQQPGGGVASPDQAPHKLFQQGGGEDGGL